VFFAAMCSFRMYVHTRVRASARECMRRMLVRVAGVACGVTVTVLSVPAPVSVVMSRCLRAGHGADSEAAVCASGGVCAPAGGRPRASRG
jgi:hypothetical protein